MKLKYSQIEKLIPLSSLQIDVLVSLARRSDERTAYVRGVYYRDVVKDTGCCNQSFYNCLNALEEHGIIKVSKESDLDYDVYICGNEYSGNGKKEEYSSETYVNLNDDVFYMKSFKQLKAHEKYLFLHFYQYTFRKGEGQTMKRNKKAFYKEMTEKLQVTAAVLRKYLHQLKLFFSIGTVGGNLLITRKNICRTKKKKDKTEEQWALEQYIISQCHRLHIEYEEAAIEGLIKLLRTKRNHFTRNGTLTAIGKLLACIEKSVAGYKPKERFLNGAFVNKLFTAKMLVAEHEEKPDLQLIYNKNNLGLCF